jgi:hypothetical protein
LRLNGIIFISLEFNDLSTKIVDSFKIIAEKSGENMIVVKFSNKLLTTVNTFEDNLMTTQKLYEPLFKNDRRRQEISPQRRRVGVTLVVTLY